jgi:two-component system sensor histidine kinase CreC
MSTQIPSRVNLADQAREWPSFHGSPVPERQDPYEVSNDFVRSMHHRLSQPITALRFSLELLEMILAENAGALQQIERALEQSSRAMELMAGFRALFEADRIETDLSPASLTYVLNEVVDDLLAVGRERGVEIVLPWNAVEAHVLASRARIRQALWNLIQNCIDLTPAGAEVQLLLQLSDGKAQIDVTDGCVLEQSEFARVFDPFSHCGTGRGGSKVSNLPLAVMQRMILAVGGEVKIRPAPSGLGRHFVLTLPACVAD